MMEKNYKTFSLRFLLVVILGLAISFLGYRLREKHFSAFPVINDTADEYKYAFNGISLIKNGVPESWSWWDNYGEFPVVRLRNMDFRMVKPYFDEPPLFGLLMGSYAISEGMDSHEKVDPGVLRWPMLKLGAVNVFLLFLLVYFCAGLSEAVLASLLYATVPTMVLSSRLPLAENFMVTLSLAALLLLLLFVKTKVGFGPDVPHRGFGDLGQANRSLYSCGHNFSPFGKEKTKTCPGCFRLYRFGLFGLVCLRGILQLGFIYNPAAGFQRQRDKNADNDY